MKSTFLSKVVFLLGLSTVCYTQSFFKKSSKLIWMSQGYKVRKKSVSLCQMTKKNTVRDSQIVRSYRREDFNYNALHYAIASENEKECQELLERGHNPNFIIRGYTPLMRAIESQNDDIAILCIRYGADIYYCDPLDNTSIIHMAFMSGCVRLIKVIISRDPSLLFKFDGSGHRPFELGKKLRYAQKKMPPEHASFFDEPIESADLCSILFYPQWIQRVKKEQEFKLQREFLESIESL